MAEKIQIRSEHSRSIEDSEKYRALHTLKRLGLLIPLSEIETFHGRSAQPDEVVPWEVDPSFVNASNDTGHHNINSRPTLYSGNRESAQAFADKRAGFTDRYPQYLRHLIDGYTPEENVGRLERQNAHQKRIWEEGGADMTLSASEREGPKVWTMEELLAGGSMVEMHHLRESLGLRGYEDFKRQYAKFARADVHEITTWDMDATVIDFGFDARKLDDTSKEEYDQALRTLAMPVMEGASAGELNASRLVLDRPIYLTHLMMKHAEDSVTAVVTLDGKRQELPIDMQYVRQYLQEAHIVGFKNVVDSATLNREIETVSFFDLEKIMTTEKLNDSRQMMWRRLGGIAMTLREIIRSEVNEDQPLMKLLGDAHAKPEKLVEAAKHVEGYEVILNGMHRDTGMTHAEHAEVVLRRFDELFSEHIPVELLAPMRLAILSRCVNNSTVISYGEHDLPARTVSGAGNFLGKLDIDTKLRELILAVIESAERLTTRTEAGISNQAAVVEPASEPLGQPYGTDDVAIEQIDGLVQMRDMLEVCDKYS